MNISLIIPPLLQLNTPYPSVPILADFLRKQGHNVSQYDFSLELALKFYSENSIIEAGRIAEKKADSDDELAFFADSAPDYARTINDVIAFLRNPSSPLAWRIAARNFLPEGPFFHKSLDPNDEGTDNESLNYAFGTMGTIDKAKYLASLYLDDLSLLFSKTLDPDFCLGKYAASLATALPSFDPLYKRLLSAESSKTDIYIDAMTKEMLNASSPAFVGISIPFPGTVYGAFRIAKAIKSVAPEVKVILGGGYVNSELRNLNDKRVFEFVDYICYDSGFQPIDAILSNSLHKADCNVITPCGNARVMSANGLMAMDNSAPEITLLAPDYSGLDLNRYISVAEMPNKLHSIWSDGTWLKLQLAQGCYWHKCAFCDVTLDYIGNYKAASAVEIVDVMEKLIKSTGKTGFHFVDEALPPALIRNLCNELLKRKLSVTWWGNIRFDKTFTPELTELMADAGCIAVTGGLECANDRLLKLMNKGISLESARHAFQAFAQSGILVHAYLMYAFPSETKEEAVAALEFVRKCFAEGLIQSAFWHRFALTVHSPIAKNPEKFGISLTAKNNAKCCFALNEIPYYEKDAPDWERIGNSLSTALYNYMLGLGLDIPVRKWF